MKYQCACGEEFETKTKWVIHLLTLRCYDENLEFKEIAKLKAGENNEVVEE